MKSKVRLKIVERIIEEIRDRPDVELERDYIKSRFERYGLYNESRSMDEIVERMADKIERKSRGAMLKEEVVRIYEEEGRALVPDEFGDDADSSDGDEDDADSSEEYDSSGSKDEFQKGHDAEPATDTGRGVSDSSAFGTFGSSGSSAVTPAEERHRQRDDDE